MEKSLIHFVVMFPASNKAPVVAEPSDGAFNLPASFITPESSAILGLRFAPILPVWSHKLDTLFSKFGAKLIRVIRFVTHQSFGFLAQLINRLVNQRYLMWTGRGKGHSQRNTLAISHHHELRTLAPLGFSDFWAPFFADTKLPSIKHSAQLIWPRLSSLLMKVRQIFNQTPSSSHILSRLQQVLGLGYFSGRSFHLAPVRKIQRIPSSTKRLFCQGRPLLFSSGKSGSISFHCFSVRYTARLIGLFPPMYLLSANQL